MRPAPHRSIRRSPLWLAVIALLLSLRLPAFVQPSGNDQNLYLYSAEQVRAGGVPYRDAWDQKPPGIAFVYAALRTVWPGPSTVAFGDIAASALTAGLLILLGRRAVTPVAGYLAASTFLLFGHPSIARLGGIYLRGQCEVFIAPAVAAAILLLWVPPGVLRSRGRLLASGLCLGVAFWLKYNALAYALPVAAALVVGTASAEPWRTRAREAIWVVAGFAALGALVLLYFAAHGALEDLRLATIDFNLRYSSETYDGPASVARYVIAMPFGRAREDMLWYLGGAGAVALLVLSPRRSLRPVAIVTMAWLLAAVMSIAANGSRGLPQYFVQAGPALGLAFAGGAVLATARGRLWTAATAVVIVVGLWRVGVERPGFAGLKLGGLPQLVSNVTLDLRHLTGGIDRPAYLARFKGQQKYSAAEIDALTALVRATTSGSDRILVFGFAPAVYVDSGRRSASRFFWSRPVILEFAADRSGYGSSGLLAELEQNDPAIVALQKQDWRPDDPNSMEFFLATPKLRDWLMAGYTLERDTPVFGVWRKRQ